MNRVSKYLKAGAKKLLQRARRKFPKRHVGRRDLVKAVFTRGGSR